MRDKVQRCCRPINPFVDRDLGHFFYSCIGLDRVSSVYNTCRVIFSAFSELLPGLPIFLILETIPKVIQEVQEAISYCWCYTTSHLRIVGLTHEGFPVIMMFIFCIPREPRPMAFTSQYLPANQGNQYLPTKNISYKYRKITSILHTAQIKILIYFRKFQILSLIIIYCSFKYFFYFFLPGCWITY